MPADAGSSKAVVAKGSKIDEILDARGERCRDATVTNKSTYTQTIRKFSNIQATESRLEYVFPCTALP
jgi:hypothetical protein